ncbi:MAG: hydroxyethylthiazole kinase [Clostridia bacterium]|nr:hydroxyethylthiazole kinase [Clostridia bacterium]
MTKDLLNKVRKQKPLVHHITNNVTVNDCANITLCTGGLPVMAYDVEEVAQMVEAAGALVLNIGTLSPQQVEAMIMAGKRANQLNIPVVLDPVGVGATSLRTDSARRILQEVAVTVIKGNKAEISILAGAGGEIKGVESIGEYHDIAQTATALARRQKCTVVVSGQEDIITDGQQVVLVENGHSLMGAVVGTGCMSASVTGCFIAVEDNTVQACAVALAAFGLAGELAAQAPFVNGPGTYKMALFDAMAALRQQQLDNSHKIKVIK